MKKRLSIVVSCYNEAQGLDQFYRATIDILKDCPWDYELIFVNDGSSDGTLQILEDLAKDDAKVKLISFSRNFGHEAAMIAGIDYATGDGVVCMDADLEHPPECIPQIIEAFEAGNDVVTMVCANRSGAGPLKRMTSKAFYRVLNVLSPIHFEENASDFFGISSRVAEVLRKDYRERVRYLRGFVQSVGFKKTSITFEAGRREHGKSHYGMLRLMSFSINTICGFSDVPLKMGIYAGLLAAVCGVVLIIYSLVMKACFNQPSGYTTIIVALCFLFALTLIVIGVIGEYIAIILQETKGRPIYIVDQCVNMGSNNGIENRKE